MNHKHNNTSHDSQRRDFLAASAGLLLATPLLSGLSGVRTLFAEPRAGLRPIAETPSLVVVYLRGGADPLNIIVPYADKTYYAVRPEISVQAETTAEEAGAIPLDNKVGLHPAMAALKPFWDKKQLAPILGTGSPHPTRSHFDAQDFMEYGAPGDRLMKNGWLNRFLRETSAQNNNPLRALAMQGLLPRSLRGKQPVLAVPQLKRNDSEGLLDLFDDVYRNSGAMETEGAMNMGGESRGREEAVEVGRHTIETLRHFWDVIDKEPEGGQQDALYGRGGFAQRLRMIARVIKNNAGLQVAALDYGGWDMHQGEGAVDGSMQRNLKELCDAIGAFATDLGPALARTNVLVMTEFGRTVAENGNRGTDHGRGSCMLLLGGGVEGGRVFGDYGSLESRNLEDGRDLRVSIDFRQVFAELLKGTFGFDAPKDFFPLYTPNPKNWMGLMHNTVKPAKK
ncbi:MAG: DUF1501 domain-containing protein [Planctomycetes bacterium]|nr:DUF1501 domain-containing protein [Planctomycetota bacterium]